MSTEHDGVGDMPTSSQQPLSIDDLMPLSSTGHSIPILGFGVYKLRGDSCVNSCLSALATGYRHIDSADLYLNSHLVREAVLRSGLDRHHVFLTTKFGSPRPRRNRTVASDGCAVEIDDKDAIYHSVRESVARIAGDDDESYVDLLLIHVPGPSREHRTKLWAAMERLHSEGKARNIGVSNFHISHLEEMRDYAARWPPSVNQIELHPWCQQRNLVSYCRSHGIVIQAYSPLATGTCLEDATLREVATKYSKSPAQILVRYALQKGWVPLPKSGNRERICENSDVFDFMLERADMAKLDALDEGVKGARFPANAHD